MKKIRCAIYTRKSSEDGLEQEFNSLDAQREACAAYVASQKHEGWVLLPAAYDDGGLSGGSLQRPALQRLLQDMAEGLVDQVVVYKIDRLTRSLADFSKIVDVLDAAGASFVSVTQSFNTATSMGRLTLNMLLSFAQFEREVTAERIRDKIAASKRKGLWMGGLVPIGYDANGRTLSINVAEAQTVRTLYDLYEAHQTVRAVTQQAAALGLKTKLRQASAASHPSGGVAFSRGHIHQILTNPLYAGRIRHRKTVHDGQHPALIDPERWERIQGMLQAGATKKRRSRSKTQSSLLCGKLFDETGDRLTPSHAKTKAGKRLRYYISHRLIAQSGEAHQGGWRLPAPELEAQIATLIAKTISGHGWCAELIPSASPDEIGRLRSTIDAYLKKTREKHLLALVAKVTVQPGEMRVTLDPDHMAQTLQIATGNIEPDCLVITTAFQIRKRGVETKLILADAPRTLDQTLIKNIARAHHWFTRITSGASVADIAKADGASKDRIQKVLPLAFLAPDIVRDVLEGKQPLSFTSDWCMHHPLPSDWQDQRALLATL